MTARELISPLRAVAGLRPERSVPADLPALDVLPRLLESPGRQLEVTEGQDSLGVIDQTSLLEGLGRLVGRRDDCSVITVECRPEDYSASALAHAVEDSDAHLVDLLSTPSADGRVRVTLRVRLSDPAPAIHNLERYDYRIVGWHAAGSAASDGVAIERLLSLRALLNV